MKEFSSICCIENEEEKANSNHQERKTFVLPSLRSAGVISYANGAHQKTDQVERTSSNDQDKVIKSFSREMIRKLCPERPRYEDHPTGEDNVDASETFIVITSRFGKQHVHVLNKAKSFYIFGQNHPVRKFALYITTNQYFEILILLTIFVNCVFLALTNPPEEPEYVFAAIYTIEMILKIIAKGFALHKFAYLRDPWNWLDFVVVILGYITLAPAEIANLSGIRTFRVFRALRTISAVKGLRTMVNTLLASMRMLWDVLILTMFFICIFALVGMQVFVGVLRNKCTEPMPQNLQISYREYASNASVWKMNADGHPKVCGNDSWNLHCAANESCLPDTGSNPNFGFTSFDHFGWAMLTSFQLVSLDFWENVYNNFPFPFIWRPSNVFSGEASFYCSIQAAFYVLFLTVLSFALIHGSTQDDPTQYSGKANGLRLFCEALSIIFLMFYFFEEVNQAEREWQTYFKDPYNYFDWLGLILTFLVIPLRFVGVDSQWSVAALGYLFNFLRLFKFSCVTRTTGLYTKTLAKIVYRDISRFCVVFVVIFLGFCGSMYMALKATASQKHFSNFSWLMLAAVRALFEQQPVEEDYSKFRWLSILILLSYMAMVIVIMLNILIAQMSYTYSEAKRTAKLQYAVDTMLITARLEYSRFARWNLRVKNYIDGDWISEKDLAKEMLEYSEDSHPWETMEEKLTNIRGLMRKVVRRVKDTDPLECIDDKLNNLTKIVEKIPVP